MTDKPILLPGIRVPALTVPAVNLGQAATVVGESPQVTVLLFCGAAPADDTAGQLAGYQERLADFAARNARVVAVTAVSPDDAKRLAAEKGIGFPLAASGLSLAGRFGVAAGEAILTAAFIIDQEGLIRRVFQQEPGEGLPEPAMVLRAITNLANLPKPPHAAADDWRLGPADAPVVIIEYGDYQCRHCRDFYQVVGQLLPRYERNVQFIFRHFPMRHAHPLAIPAARAAEAAGLQGRFWDMHARLFAANDALARENLLQYACELGLDGASFAVDLDGESADAAVMEDYHTAVKHKIKSPPTVFVNGILFDGPHTESALQARIDELLARLA